MKTRLKSVVGMGVLVAAIATAGPAFSADQWLVKADDSKIAFSATQLGSEFEGAFNTFNAEIVFSPDDLAGSHVSVVIDIASVDTASADRDSQIVSPDWFDVAQWPTATFETKSFRETAPGTYEAVADLTIRDVTREVTLPFELNIDGNTAEAKGAVTINRTDFGVGQGQWSDVSQIADPVTITIDIDADRQ